MSVLSIAERTTTVEGDEPASASSNSGERTTSEKTVDLAEKVSRAFEDFFSGLLPGPYRVKLDWATLAPLISTLSSVGSFIVILTRYN